jgi:CelD/BcsL family acetyltransferase involved in cellulose biosynthesis
MSSAPAYAGNLRFSTFHGRDGLGELRDAWRTLEMAAPALHVYQTYDWYECMLNHLARDGEAYIFVLATQRDSVIAIFPFRLEVETQLGLNYRVLDLPTHPHVLLRSAALHPRACRTDIFRKLISYLQRLSRPGWDVLRIHRVPADSPMDNLCRTIDSPLRVSWSSGSVSVIGCGDKGTDNLSHLSARFRRNLRRLGKRASAQGPTKLVACRGPETLQRGLRLFLEVEHDSWKSASRSSVASDENLVNYYTSLSQAKGDTYECQINLLQVGDETIAAQFGIRSHDTFFVLKIGHRQAFAGVGPGNLLLSEAVHYFSDDPHIALVNLTTAPPWTEKWKSHSISLMTHCIFRRSLTGMAICMATRIKARIGRNGDA